MMNRDGTVKNHTKISDTQEDFNGILDDGDYFGSFKMMMEVDLLV